jgi:hypothetical protein
VRRPVVLDRDAATADDPGAAANADGTDVLEPSDMRCVVRLIGVEWAVHHVVAPLGRATPGVGGRVRGVLVGGVEQRLGGNAADERAAPPEPLAVDDRHGRVPGTGLVGRSLAGRSGADDHEVVGRHRVSVLAQGVTVR